MSNLTVRIFLMIVFFCAPGLFGVQTALAAPQVSSSHIRQQLQSEKSALGPKLTTFYRQRGFMPVWRDSNGWLLRATQAFSVLDASERKGLRSPEYIDRIFTGPSLNSPDRIAQADIALTRGVMKYIRDVRFGRYNPKADYGPGRGRNGRGQARNTAVTQNGWPENGGPKNGDDTIGYLSAGLRISDFGGWFKRAGPATREYQRLLNALNEYEALVNRGGWPRLKPGGTLKQGMRDPRVPVLRKILALMGDYPLDEAARESLVLMTGIDTRGLGDDIGIGGRVFGKKLTAAVKSFQNRHGLEVDGILGGRSQNVIRIRASDRLDQIKINLERLRWDRARDHERFVRVNIPEFKLRVFDKGEKVMEMAVVVGRDERPTPVLNDYITNVKFNPDWTLPKSIIEEDVVPEMQIDPAYAIENHLETIIDGRVVDPATVDWTLATPANVSFKQLPGPKNPLGSYRFSMTNDQAIFLHDTPKKYLFGNTDRANSSGCVRVGDAEKLAEFLIDTPDWTKERTGEIIESMEIKYLKLRKPVAVSLVYFTAWVGDDGKVHFRNDLYGRDLELMAKMI